MRVLRNIHCNCDSTSQFALDKSYISPASAAILDQIAEVLKEYPFIVIELQGHTDIRASREYNIALAQRRSLAARNCMLRQGIAPERMTIRSFGESELRTSGTTIVDPARNRRVEIIFRDLR